MKADNDGDAAPCYIILFTVTTDDNGKVEPNGLGARAEERRDRNSEGTATDGERWQCNAVLN